MATIKPFRGLRPIPDYAAKVASPPYDVLNSDEARSLAKGNEHSFLHVNKPEIDLDPGINVYDPAVYKQGAKNLQKLIDNKILIQDESPCFYLYRQIMGKHSQLGLVALTSVDEYIQDKIKKHELTRHDKEEDRVNHILNLNAQTGPVFLTYKAKESINSYLTQLVNSEPIYDFRTDDDIQHTFWVISDIEAIEKIEEEFKTIDALYVADGHHRSAAAARACEYLKKEKNHYTGNEAYNYFLTVIFPHNQMQILDYNRVVKDLNNLTKSAYLDRLNDSFLVREYSKSKGYKPSLKHDFGMYLNKTWYRLSAIPGTWDESKPTQRLDVSILYENILKPILNIGDLRQDKRIDFVGGMRGLKGLEKRVDSGDMAIAFSLFPTTIQDLLDIADAGETMPPKSTWFEPKLRSGLIVHLLS
jgi:uncharacterized protein (DUF1015 family)